jgi:hypothetical protein
MDAIMPRKRSDQPLYPTQESDALLAAMQGEGCPICQVVLEAMEQTMNTWQYEGFTDVEHRYELIRTRGFCPLHTWQLAQHNTTFQLALVYQEIMSTVLDSMDAPQAYIPQRKAGWLTRIKNWLKPQLPSAYVTAEQLYASCPLCRARANAEQRILETFLSLLHTEEIQTRFCQSMGLCRLHFLRASEQATAKALPQREALIRCQRMCLQRLHQELQEQIRKHDYHASDELYGEEMTAWRRAAKWSAGEPGIY